MGDLVKADFAALGAQIEQDETEERQQLFEVWECNTAVFEAFLALETQWRILVLSTLDGARVLRTGLDYSAVDVVMRRLSLPDAGFADIQAMELAALGAYSEAFAQ